LIHELAGRSRVVNTPQNPSQYHRVAPGLLLLLLVSLSLWSQTGGFRVRELLAIKGFSSFELVQAQLNPESFTRDFPGGARLTTASPLSWLHVGAAELGVDSVLFYYLMVVFEILVFLAGANVLWTSLFSQLPGRVSNNLVVRNWSFVVLSAVLLLSNAQASNLGRFGFPFFHGQFYGFADGLRLAAIGLALRRKWWQSALCLSAAFVIHPIKGAFGSVVVLVIAIHQINQSRSLRKVLPLAIFPLIATIWSLITLRPPTEGVPLGDFIAWTRVFQSHWYPLDLGVFGARQFEYFAPFSFLIISALLALNLLPVSAMVRRGLSYSMVSLTFLTGLGVVFSRWPVSEFLIKFSLVRASTLMVLLAVFVVVLSSLYFVTQKRYGWASFYTAQVALFFLPTSAFHLYSLALLAIPIAIFIFKSRTLASGAIGSSYVIVLGIHLVNLSSEQFISHFLVGAAVGLMIFGLVWFFMTILRPSDGRWVPAVLAVFVLAAGGQWASIRVDRTLPDVEYAREYLAVQEWAMINTGVGDLFMVDPCLNYGWRDFSGRASLGTPREWFMTGWIYSGDGSVLRRGNEISESLGLQLDPRILGPQSKAKVCDLARDAYYSPGSAGLIAIARDHGVSHFVLLNEETSRRGLELEPGFAVEFSNSSFTVVQYGR